MILIRKGEYSYGEVLMNIDGNKIREGEYSRGKILLNIDGNKIKEGEYSRGKVLLNIDGNKIKEGEYPRGKILLNIDGHKIKEGEYSRGKILLNIDGNKIKEGEYPRGKVLYNFSEELSSVQLIAILFALGVVKPEVATPASAKTLRGARTSEELGAVLADLTIAIVGRWLNSAMKKIRAKLNK
jgi:hypothetical protein